LTIVGVKNNAMSSAGNFVKPKIVIICEDTIWAKALWN